MVEIKDWHTWHDEYDEPGSELGDRLRTVRGHVADAVTAAPPGPVTIVSICGGQGRDLAGALAGHPRHDDVAGRLVELDADNTSVASQALAATGLGAIEVVTGDASVSDAYAGLAPADLVVISGLFGHIDDDDHERLVGFLPQILKPGGRVVWTFTRLQPERVDPLRRRYADAGLEELAFDLLEGDRYLFTVGVNVNANEPRDFEAGVKLFDFGSSRRNRRSDGESS
jgi:SAM-dependent methyltransferase